MSEQSNAASNAELAILLAKLLLEWSIIVSERPDKATIEEAIAALGKAATGKTAEQYLEEARKAAI
jgi:hypothetical protein